MQMDHDDTHAWLPEAGLGPDPVTVREVLAIRPGGLGEVVRAVPALRHLRETYPAARISVAAHAPARDLLEACPYVDRAIALERPSEARIERFDVAISFAHPGEPLVVGVDDVSAGFRASWREHGEGTRGALTPTWPVRLDETTRMLRLAWLLGGELQGESSLGLWPSLADRNGAARLVSDATRPIALIHVGAERAARRWPADRWTRVIDLVDSAGLDPVLVGTGVDADAAEAVLAAVQHAPISVVGRTSVGELVGLLERAVLFVGSDSGPAALAGSLGVRSIVIGPGSVLEHTARPGVVDLIDAGACEDCGEVACLHPPRDAAAVSLERVLGRVELAATTALQRWNGARIA
jgi:ADP-heptose:LPS heptosyltransferase